jgi:hypothetical protein
VPLLTVAVSAGGNDGVDVLSEETALVPLPPVSAGGAPKVAVSVTVSPISRWSLAAASRCGGCSAG